LLRACLSKFQNCPFTVQYPGKHGNTLLREYKWKISYTTPTCNKLGHPPIKSKTGHHNLSHVIFFFPFPANPIKFSPVTTGLPDRFSISRPRLDSRGDAEGEENVKNKGFMF
jgi:hypothetical protein